MPRGQEYTVMNVYHKKISLSGFVPTCLRISLFCAFLFFAAGLSGCGWLVKKQSLPQPAPSISEQEELERLLQRLNQKAKKLKNLYLEGYVQVTFRKKNQPKIRFQLYWMENGGRDLLRVKGLGLFGTNVFDLLINTHTLWLYIPKYKRVFWQPMHPHTPPLLIQKAGLILNPWRISIEQGSKCENASFDRQNGSLAVKCQGKSLETTIFFKDYASITPYLLLSPDVTISYQDHVTLGETKQVIYPARISVDFQKIPLHLAIQVKRGSVDPVPEHRQQIFGHEPFATLPVSPLKELLNNF